MFYKNWFEEHEDKIWKDFYDYLSIPSISADNAYKKDLLRAADFVQDRLEDLCFDVHRWTDLETPIIFASKFVDKSLPTVLIYGHYDVQPADPLELWNSDPFTPIDKDGIIYARGAEDNKGQNFYTLVALEAFYKKHKNPNINVKVIIEGEEEIGSPNFDVIAKKYSQQLQADYLWIVDMGIESYDNPLLSLGVRGIAALELIVSNADYDLHSGSYGGLVHNPILALCEMLGTVYDKKGNIVIDNFYEGADVLSDEEKSSIYLDTDKETYQKETSAKCFREREGYNLQEIITMCPSFEVNGISGGYQGEGSKTIIPKDARAKITCRLVGNQEPEDIINKIEKYFMNIAPKGMNVRIIRGGGGNSAWAKPSNYSAQVFAKIIEDLTNRECKFCYSGGSIPLTSILGKSSGAEYIFLGTALPEDRIHSPNENFSKRQFIDGYYMITKGLEIFAENKKQ